MRYFIELSYLGTAYHGWQRQNNATTVQECIEVGLSTILRCKTEVTGCGRTDAGVHAKQFFLHFDHEGLENPEKLAYALNGILPLDISIHGIREVAHEAHTRFDASARSYEYWIHQKKNPFVNGLSHYFRLDLDIAAMNEAADLLLSTKEFGAFCKAGSDNKTMLCDVSEARWEQKDGQLIFHITADRFLRNMVRALVGTLISVGQGVTSLSKFQEIIKSQNRSEAGLSAPAQGLYLVKIKYPYINE
jgi:tRNA pseudouridine38-40 synthase